MKSITIKSKTITIKVRSKFSKRPTLEDLENFVDEAREMGFSRDVAVYVAVDYYQADGSPSVTLAVSRSEKVE